MLVANFGFVEKTDGSRRDLIKEIGETKVRAIVVWENGGSWLPDYGLYVSFKISGREHDLNVVQARRTPITPIELLTEINKSLDYWRTAAKAEMVRALAKYEALDRIRFDEFQK